jgi:hypothetical protein
MAIEIHGLPKKFRRQWVVAGYSAGIGIVASHPSAWVHMAPNTSQYATAKSMQP